MAREARWFPGDYDRPVARPHESHAFLRGRCSHCCMKIEWPGAADPCAVSRSHSKNAPLQRARKMWDAGMTLEQIYIKEGIDRTTLAEAISKWEMDLRHEREVMRLFRQHQPCTFDDVGHLCKNRRMSKRALARLRVKGELQAIDTNARGKSIYIVGGK